MKKILSIILITACLACGCSSASDTEKNASKSTASEPESIDFFAMDTTIKFSAYGDKKVLKGAKKVLTDLEKKVSVTDSGSEIYHINQNGSGTLTGDVSDLMQKAWGFTTGDYQVPDESTIQSLLPMVDYTKVEFDKTTGNVTIPSGMTIDLGSIAKGYAGQQSAQYLRDNGVKSALLNLGGNVQTIGSKPDGSPWKVGIKDPNGDTPMMVLSITDQAVITSGGYERYFEQDGHTYWHIMDPATGHPADSGLCSVTIVGDDGGTCDALSTSLFVMGLEKAADFWGKSNDFEAVFGSESVLIHCLFYIAMRSEEAAGGRLCRSISHKSILPNLLYVIIMPYVSQPSFISLPQKHITCSFLLSLVVS